MFQLGNHFAGGTRLNTQSCRQLPLCDSSRLAQEHQNPLLTAFPLVEPAHGVTNIPQIDNQAAVDAFRHTARRMGRIFSMISHNKHPF